MQSKWRSLVGKHYFLRDLGRPAVFLIPVAKLRKRHGRKTVERVLHEFLSKNFDAYTVTSVPNFGFWKGDDKRPSHDRCCEYEVAFLGKDRIFILLSKLAEIAAITGEKCIYFKAGQYACLVYPKKSSL